MSTVDQLNTAIGVLQSLRDELVASETDVHVAPAAVPPDATVLPPPAQDATLATEAPTLAAVAAAPEPPPEEAPAVALPVEHDNALPFKCPLCGKTFDEQVVCQNQHPPQATLPTDQVLAGATSEDASTGETASSGSSSTSTSPPGPEAPTGISGEGAPPQWPS